MAESKVSSKDTPRQELIKHFDTGVVSYYSFSKFHDEQSILYDRIKFLTGSGFTMDKKDMALDTIETLIDHERKRLDEAMDRACQERNGAGGNNVMTIKQKATGVEV